MASAGLKRTDSGGYEVFLEYSKFINIERVYFAITYTRYSVQKLGNDALYKIL